MTKHPRHEELASFKSQINLSDFLLSYGFVYDQRRSSRRSAVLRHEDGSKIVVSQSPRGEWRYFNVHNDGDSGTIVDFVQRRRRVSLGHVRKELRQWMLPNAAMTSSRLQAMPCSRKLQYDPTSVATRWGSASPISGVHQYLEIQRQIPSGVLRDPIFADRIRSERRRNVLFAHYADCEALCGFEIKNRDFTGFSPGGRKGLFSSCPRPDDSELWICETAIDALSVAALFGTSRRRFISIAGQPSPFQRLLIQNEAQSMAAESMIVLAMDNDDGGRKLAQLIASVLKLIDIGSRRVITKLPDQEGEDYNDVLRRGGHHPFRSPCPS